MQRIHEPQSNQDEEKSLTRQESLEQKIIEYMKKYEDENVPRNSYAELLNLRCENCKKFRKVKADGEHITCKEYLKLFSLEKEPEQLREKYLTKYSSKCQESCDGDLLDFIPSLKDKKKEELEKAKNTAIERFLLRQPVYAKRLEEIEKEKEKTKKKIVKCLHRRAFLAVRLGHEYFDKQELCIADCKVCLHYFAEGSFCTQRRYPLKNKRGVCKYFELNKDKFSRRREEDDWWFT